MWLRDLVGILVNIFNRQRLSSKKKVVRFLAATDGELLFEKIIYSDINGIHSEVLKPMIETYIYDVAILLYNGIIVGFAYPTVYCPNIYREECVVIQFTVLYRKDVLPEH
tara:strand:+ start:46 stop:375 length:330 start_codon:yes stop_codon:yes gene_type:complete